MIKFYSINPRFFILLLISAFLIEIAGFIFVGKEIGILATLSLVILTTIIGIILLRIQGLNLFKNIQREFTQGHTLKNHIMDDAFITLGAFLLILPGFVSDVLGILLLIKPVRTVVWHLFSSLSNKINTHTKNNTTAQNDSEKIIDLKAEDYKIHDAMESPWRKNDDNP
ncbi:FxsA family protein [Bartonella vinsonii]|uniref:FxsA family protein n=1 Tax=Bartonella vinsonii TaxID=33047 RepID=UPI0002B6BAD0|nr:FxsA family protein [Bartonella vinsonii]AGF75250.1 FxsA cytoplasmic membrane protein [Bartonella vinsonii subsp. berkhoffii str. Winnie]